MQCRKTKKIKISLTDKNSLICFYSYIVPSKTIYGYGIIYLESGTSINTLLKYVGLNVSFSLMMVWYLFSNTSAIYNA